MVGIPDLVALVVTAMGFYVLGFLLGWSLT